MKQLVVCWAVVTCFAACIGGPLEPDAAVLVLADAGPLPDGGTPQCNADGTRCWPKETYCEAAPCTYQFPDTGGTCGATSIRPSCFCARDGSGAFHVQCTGGCPPSADGGFSLLCLTPNCGTVQCGTGTTCVDRGRCE